MPVYALLKKLDRSTLALLSSFPTFFCLGCRCLHVGQWTVAGAIVYGEDTPALECWLYIYIANFNLLPVVLDFLSFISETNPNIPRNSELQKCVTNNSFSSGACWGHFSAETNHGGWRKKLPLHGRLHTPKRFHSKGNSRSHCVII